MSAPCGKGNESQGEKHVRGLIAIFNSYACKDKDTTHLNKTELKSLLETEFPTLIKGTKNPEEVNKRMAALDFDGDGQVDIEEYFITLCFLGICMSMEGGKEGQCSKKC